MISNMYRIDVKLVNKYCQRFFRNSFHFFHMCNVITLQKSLKLFKTGGREK